MKLMIASLLDVNQIDALTRRLTAAANFAELADGMKPDYTPTLAGEAAAELADIYDCEMELRSDTRRAWRGL